jgi:hypothetical protein
MDTKESQRIKVQGYSAQGGKVGREKAQGHCTRALEATATATQERGKENRVRGRLPPISLFFFPVEIL